MEPSEDTKMTLRRLLILALYFSCFQVALAQTPEWKVKPTLSKELEGRMNCGRFSIRFPSGGLAVFDTLKDVTWRGRGGGSGIIIKFRPDQDLLKFVRSEKARARKYYANWRSTKPKKGLINGVTFLRTRFSGVSLAPGEMNGVKYQGVIYCAKFRQKIITCQALIPAESKFMPIVEASLMTLKLHNP